MSTAILISGQLRTFSECWPTQRWHVLRHFDDCHFFITVQDPAPVMALDILSPLIEEYGPDRVHLDLRTDPDLSADLTPELSAAYHQAPYTNAAPAHQLLLQHWYQAEVWKTFENARTRDFVTIIRMRADLWFHSFECPAEFSESSASCVLPTSFASSCFTPWWGRFGGINDRFAIMGLEAAGAYFTLFDALPDLLAAGCPFHPESLVAANLERGHIDVHPTLRTEFSTLRTSGQIRPPEITPWDMAHAALRAA